jgi:hypothetical protein
MHFFYSGPDPPIFRFSHKGLRLTQIDWLMGQPYVAQLWIAVVSRKRKVPDDVPFILVGRVGRAMTIEVLIRSYTYWSTSIKTWKNKDVRGISAQIRKGRWIVMTEDCPKALTSRIF